MSRSVSVRAGTASPLPAPGSLGTRARAPGPRHSTDVIIHAQRERRPAARAARAGPGPHWHGRHDTVTDDAHNKLNEHPLPSEGV